MKYPVPSLNRLAGCGEFVKDVKYGRETTSLEQATMVVSEACLDPVMRSRLWRTFRSLEAKLTMYRRRSSKAWTSTAEREKKRRMRNQETGAYIRSLVARAKSLMMLDTTERIMRSVGDNSPRGFQENIPDARKMIDCAALANTPIPGECPEQTGIAHRRVTRRRWGPKHRLFRLSACFSNVHL